MDHETSTTDCPGLGPNLAREFRHHSPTLEERRQAVLRKVFKMRRRESGQSVSDRGGSACSVGVSREGGSASPNGEDDLAGTGNTTQFFTNSQGAGSLVRRSVLSMSQTSKVHPTASPVKRESEIGEPPQTSSPQKRLAVVLAPTPMKRREEYVEVGEEELGREAEEAPASKQQVSSKETTATPVAATTAGGATEPSKMKRRGRPKGWKPGMAYTDLRPRSARAATSRPAARTSTNGGQKRRGRPPKATSPPPRQIYRQENAEFFMFICEWRGCRAELHNLETLRRHIAVVHGMEEGCSWGVCKFAVARGQRQRGWLRKHVEQEHLIPLAWHVGDGPRHRGDGVHTACTSAEGGDMIPTWLKDEHGNQVTEGIWTQQLEDKATWRERRRKLRELLIRRDENLPSEEEEEGVDVVDDES